MSTKDVEQIRELVESWAKAIRDEDMEGVLARHTEDVVMFDVPLPLENRGMDEYRKTWELFFRMQGKGAFYPEKLEIFASGDVGYGHCLVTCGGNDKKDQFQVRLTMGFRKIDGEWMIEHEHHSAPAE